MDNGQFSFLDMRTNFSSKISEFSRFVIDSNEWQKDESHSVEDPVHTKPEELKNWGLTLKTHQMFSVHSTQGRILNSSSNHRSFFICVWGKLGQGIEPRDYCDIIAFVKLRFSKCFLYTIKCFQIPPVWRAPFSWRISVDVRPGRKNKAAVLNLSCAV